MAVKRSKHQNEKMHQKTKTEWAKKSLTKNQASTTEKISKQKK
jgi:hypothetical protein